ncbi:MAG TPA: TraR/DksA family transcriptional regulator [Bryobacteraceae bacterium]|jgi:DnaK suppressor protein
MTTTELKVFRAALESKQKELAIGNRNREALAIDTSPDELDRIQHSQERELAIGVLDRNATLVREVRAALARMNAGAFGICVGCEDEIKPQRLAAIPWASCCIACQEAADREEKAPAGEFDASLELAA